MQKITLTVTHILLFNDVENKSSVITVPVKLSVKKAEALLGENEYFLKLEHEKQQFEIKQDELYHYLVTNGTQILGGNK